MQRKNAAFRVGAAPLRTIAVVAAGLLASSCTAMRGTQEPITETDVGKSVCPSEADVTEFDSASADARTAVRDRVVSKCIDAVDRKYNEFKGALQKEGSVTNLSIDSLAILLTGSASLLSGNTAKDLSAAATAVLGIGSAINKDVFYQQTLPAIEAAMDTGRDKVHTRIVQAEAADPTAKSYTLASARSDIAAYEAAGNIYTAISQLTTTANEAAQSTKDALATAKVAYTAQVIDAAVYTREKALTDAIRAIGNANDRVKLDKIANALHVPPNADLSKERNDVIAAIGSRVMGVSVDPKKAMDEVSALLSDTMGRSY